MEQPGYELIECEGFWTHEGVLCELNPAALARLRELVKGRVVYEIGPGHRGGLLKLLMGAGFARYVGVQPGSCPKSLKGASGSGKVGFAGLDGLAFLKTTPPESGIVISSAVMNPETLTSPEYLDALVQQIARVTPGGGSTMHFDFRLSEFANPVFERHGLKPRLVGRRYDPEVLCAEVYEYQKA